MANVIQFMDEKTYEIVTFDLDKTINVRYQNSGDVVVVFKSGLFSVYSGKAAAFIRLINDRRVDYRQSVWENDNGDE